MKVARYPAAAALGNDEERDESECSHTLTAKERSIGAIES